MSLESEGDPNAIREAARLKLSCLTKFSLSPPANRAIVRDMAKQMILIYRCFTTLWPIRPAGRS
ncbi:hypothetical protein MES5069_360098 [Mesorhizobium escarrei]|uniref:Uncharacterized protein n=1 Tax=Mesorhizobium escarrei TaxID=666018 RepID=A0ABM9E1N2_9HYPH|nr:hypothetical protein MES5069_360098 [Mesorhizobium escarrei]